MLDPRVEEDERDGGDAAPGGLERAVAPFVVSREAAVARWLVSPAQDEE